MNSRVLTFGGFPFKSYHMLCLIRIYEISKKLKKLNNLELWGLCKVTSAFLLHKQWAKLTLVFEARKTTIVTSNKGLDVKSL